MAAKLWRLWIDGYGGFTVVTADRWSIGRSALVSALVNADEGADGSDSLKADVGVVSDLPRMAGWFSRDQHRVSFESCGNGTERDLSDKSVDLSVGAVQLNVACASPINRTRVVKVTPPHRWSGHVDGVLWIDGAVTIGAGRQHSLRHLALKDWLVLSAPTSTVGWCLRRPNDGWEVELELGRRLTRDELSLTIQAAERE